MATARLMQYASGGKATLPGGGPVPAPAHEGQTQGCDRQGYAIGAARIVGSNCINRVFRC